jgi:ribosome-binding protein aMBF1 (putative translation factor)
MSKTTRAQKDAAATPASKNSASASATAATTVDDTTKMTKYISKITSDTIRQARCDKKLTQKELAQKCNMDVSIIAEIERGSNCVYNPGHINKIQSILGVKIPRA